MFRRAQFCGVTTAVTPAAAAGSAALCVSQLVGAQRQMKIRKENWFENEAVPHSRRVSWSPMTTTKKQGAFARLSRSNFYDPTPTPFSAEPYVELQVEAHRARNQPDVYIYKYNVSPTHLSLRPEKRY